MRALERAHRAARLAAEDRRPRGSRARAGRRRPPGRGCRAAGRRRRPGRRGGVLRAGDLASAGTISVAATSAAGTARFFAVRAPRGGRLAAAQRARPASAPTARDSRGRGYPGGSAKIAQPSSLIQTTMRPGRADGSVRAADACTRTRATVTTRTSNRSGSRSASSAAASAGSPRRCRCCGPGSTSTSTSRRAALGEVGAGIQVSPNASRVLHRLGLADDAGAARACGRWPGTSAAGTTAGRCCARRSARAARGGVRLPALPDAPRRPAGRAGRRAARRAPAPRPPAHRPGRPRRPRRGAVRQRRAAPSVDVLVGADGIHSHGARALFGPEHPRFTGCVAYRGLVPAERLRHLELEVTAQVWMGPGRALRALLRAAAGGWSTSSRSSSRTPGRASRGPIAARSRTRSPPSRAGTRRSAAILGAVDETFIWALFDRTAAAALVRRAG